MLMAACSPQTPDNQTVEAKAGVMDHLRCAALISAADHLMNSGNVPNDPAFRQAALVAGMTHLNAHAIPARIAEKDAFAAVDRERARIIGEIPGEQIVEQAKACVARAGTIR
ncbi:hypothetical protein P1X14_15970 [Sphingomonas sp. AOB5]|uniref:hypothetical protein n=1 Tax=Sphingomonas sp. AOB5 TaxID=3034017 RepID=UPI0023FA1E21|nr:hypothetical protein [Sphingomonas sp. AOB5]MDF7776755.1 hypothetical protein [Sphingomonas sp. AOB5]